MKNIYVSICALLVANVTFGQSRMVEMPREMVAKHVANEMLVTTPSMASSATAPFWSEDFANGIPSTWTNSTVPWVYRGTATTPNNTVGGQGAYSGINNSPATNNPIESETAANGFIIFDSDFYDNAGVVGDFGLGLHATPHDGILMTDMIDLSSYADVTLKLHSYFRTYAGQAFIDFYISGVFTERLQIHASLAVNASTSIDEIALARVPLSVVGNADVQMSFVFEGSTNLVNNFSGYYFWQIDDLELMETPVNQIEIEDVVTGGYWMDYANYTANGLNVLIGLDYTVTPSSQLANHPYVIEGVLRNSGATDQTSMLKYEVYGAGTYSGSSVLTPVAAYSATNTIDSVIVSTTPSLSPQVGLYGISIWGESDSAGIITAVSDTIYKGMEVSDYIYGKDLGDANPGSYILGGVEDQNHITTRYEMYADEQLTGLRAFISDRSHVGAEVKAIIYELDTTASDGVILLGESDNYILTSQDLGAWIDIPFDGGIDLFTGYAYEFGIVGFIHPTDSSYVGTAGTSLYNGEHSLFDELGLNTQSAGAATWYYITATPMVRMNFDPSLIAGVSNVEQTIFNTYPNPTNGVFIIELGVGATENNYDVTVNNVLGQTVLSTSTKGMTTIIDLSNFDKGVYTVELKDRNTTYTEKVIVE